MKIQLWKTVETSPLFVVNSQTFNCDKLILHMTQWKSMSSTACKNTLNDVYGPSPNDGHSHARCWTLDDSTGIAHQVLVVVSFQSFCLDVAHWTSMIDNLTTPSAPERAQIVTRASFCLMSILTCLRRMNAAASWISRKKRMMRSCGSGLNYGLRWSVAWWLVAVRDEKERLDW